MIGACSVRPEIGFRTIRRRVEGGGGVRSNEGVNTRVHKTGVLAK